MDFKSFWRQGGGHLFAPLHKHHRVLAGVFKFFVQSQRFQLVLHALWRDWFLHR